MDRLPQSPREWPAFVAHYAPRLALWLTIEGVWGHDNEDVAQEFWLKVFRRPPTSEPTGLALVSWMRAVAANAAKDHHKAKRARTRGESAAARHEVVEAASTVTDRDALCEKVAGMVRRKVGPAAWSAFWRVAVLGESPESVALEVGSTVVAVGRAKRRVAERIRRRVLEVEGGSGFHP